MEIEDQGAARPAAAKGFEQEPTEETEKVHRNLRFLQKSGWEGGRGCGWGRRERRGAKPESLSREKAQKSQNHKTLCAFCTCSRPVHCAQSCGLLSKWYRRRGRGKGFVNWR